MTLPCPPTLNPTLFPSSWDCSRPCLIGIAADSSCGFHFYQSLDLVPMMYGNSKSIHNCECSSVIIWRVLPIDYQAKRALLLASCRSRSLLPYVIAIVLSIGEFDIFPMFPPLSRSTPPQLRSFIAAFPCPLPGPLCGQGRTVGGSALLPRRLCESLPHTIRFASNVRTQHRTLLAPSRNNRGQS